jgi:putative nucleotidyltransferase with HDIG domain
MKTIELLNRPDFDYGDVAGLIKRSPSMAGEFIKVINSSLYSRGIVISDLKLALPRLGKENVKAMLYVYSAKMNFEAVPILNDLAVDIVEHSYATALVAGYLSQRYYPDPEGAFLAGLLHDIGKLGLLKAIAETHNLPKKHHTKLVEETFGNVLPDLHQKAGRVLALNWKTHETVLSAVEHHHDFFDIGFNEDDQLSYHLCALINLSDIIARVLGKGRAIGPTNIFGLPATIDLSMEKNRDTIKFIDPIPKIVSYGASMK